MRLIHQGDVARSRFREVEIFFFHMATLILIRSNFVESYGTEFHIALEIQRLCVARALLRRHRAIEGIINRIIRLIHLQVGTDTTACNRRVVGHDVVVVFGEVVILLLIEFEELRKSLQKL